MFKQIKNKKNGINFENILNPSETLNILTYLYYYNGAGVSCADYNGDGKIDIYFVSNQGEDKLFLNQGNFKFEDITHISGIQNETGWSFGVSSVDINADGLLDIYISKVGKYKSIVGKNLLFINQGVNDQGVPQFKEQAAVYGLDIVGLCTQTAFFDYDLDGDLDAYVLNHSVHPNRSYGLGKKRFLLDTLSGDKLLENVDGKFIDVSKHARIYQGSIGYGLDISLGDLNNDGYTDIYVGNDFFENDYLYINNGDKTFTEIIGDSSFLLGHTTHFSMGNAIADLNNDGWQDIISLDMLPESLESLKRSGTEYHYPIYQHYLKNGYSPQFMQNTLHLNQRMGFSESAFIHGIAATDWSWGVLIVDFDRDTYKDLYITNGILGATNDMDYVKFISQKTIQKQLDNPKLNNLDFIKEIPARHLTNYAFKNKGNHFENVSDSWFDLQPSFSAGATYADLDNDGDYDIVVNNTNGQPFIFENTINVSESSNYLKIKMKGKDKNYFGIGTKFLLYMDNQLVKEEFYPNQTYLSSVANEIIVGLGQHSMVDSLIVIWPGGQLQKLINIESNQTLTLQESDASSYYYLNNKHNKNSYLMNVSPMITFEHNETISLDFDREPLIPYAKSNEGPALSVGDLNGDGKQDVFLGGAKKQKNGMYFQSDDEIFQEMTPVIFQEYSINEVTGSHFFDFDGDNDLDVILVSGGNEFRKGKPLQPLLFVNDQGSWKKTDQFKDVFLNASCVKSIDFDLDQDVDIVITSNTITGKFGVSDRNYLFKNDKGTFKDVTSTLFPDFLNVGLIEDIEIIDFDNNGYPDIVVAGYWMPITIFLNDGKNFYAKEMKLETTNGFWNTLVVADFDNDGDNDIIAGNWGLNSRLQASLKEPITYYRSDFFDNGKEISLVSYYYQGVETALASKDELYKQLPHLNKKFLTYRSFSEASFYDLFGKEKLRKADKKYVFNLASCYFENQNNQFFLQKSLPFEAQLSTIEDIIVEDFNGDGFKDVLMVGNRNEISTQIGQMDASHGLILLNDQNGFFSVVPQSFSVAGSARQIRKVTVKDQEYFIVAMNNKKPIFLKKMNINDE